MGQDTLQISKPKHYQVFQSPFISVREKQSKGGRATKKGNGSIITIFLFTWFPLWVRLYVRFCHLLLIIEGDLFLHVRKEVFHR